MPADSQDAVNLAIYLRGERRKLNELFSEKNVQTFIFVLLK